MLHSGEASHRGRLRRGCMPHVRHAATPACVVETQRSCPWIALYKVSGLYWCAWVALHCHTRKQQLMSEAPGGMPGFLELFSGQGGLAARWLGGRTAGGGCAAWRVNLGGTHC